MRIGSRSVVRDSENVRPGVLRRLWPTAAAKGVRRRLTGGDTAAVGSEDAYGFLHWMRMRDRSVPVLLTGSLEKAVRRAGEFCEEGPNLARPYDHDVVLDEMRSAFGASWRTPGSTRRLPPGGWFPLQKCHKNLSTLQYAAFLPVPPWGCLIARKSPKGTPGISHGHCVSLAPNAAASHSSMSPVHYANDVPLGAGWSSRFRHQSGAARRVLQVNAERLKEPKVSP